LPFIAVFKELNRDRDIVYRKNDLWAYKITPSQSLHDFLISQTSKISDESRRLKSLLSGFIFDEPYWEMKQKHSPDTSYLFADENVCGYSLAEACERSRVIISFYSEKFYNVKINIQKNNTENVILDNLFAKGHCNEINRERNIICIKEYCINKFKGSKLDFSKIDDKDGFTLLKKEDEELFIDGFRKFSELSWQQINIDDALDYKPYPDSDRIFRTIPYKIHKFRISRKYRCFGYVVDGIFYILRFDLEHKLSD
jgi:hypothetical protein